MLDILTSKSTDYLILNEVIAEDDRDVYEYGFHALYNNIIDISSIAIISVWLNQVPQTILYHISFIILRNIAGGFHAKTHLRCFIMSTVIWLLSLLAISMMALPLNCLGLAGVAVVLIWVKAPVEHDNSPLSAEKHRRMKLYSRVASAVFFTIILFTYLLMKEYIWIAVSLAYGMASHAFLILGSLLQARLSKTRGQAVNLHRPMLY
ncbi:MAG: accessory gene regulator B family protein [Clostridiales bacterium]|nr:accessory gene regulator B family protein [Clostridiales bacterium]